MINKRRILRAYKGTIMFLQQLLMKLEKTLQMNYIISMSDIQEKWMVNLIRLKLIEFEINRSNSKNNIILMIDNNRS